MLCSLFSLLCSFFFLSFSPLYERDQLIAHSSVLYRTIYIVEGTEKEKEKEKNIDSSFYSLSLGEKIELYLLLLRLCIAQLIILTKALCIYTVFFSHHETNLASVFSPLIFFFSLLLQEQICVACRLLFCYSSVQQVRFFVLCVQYKLISRFVNLFLFLFLLQSKSI